jgi:hypothetical protein
MITFAAALDCHRQKGYMNPRALGTAGGVALGRFPAVLLLAVLVGMAVASTSTQARDDLPAALQAEDYEDILPWNLGDSWSYHIVSVLTDGTDTVTAYSWTDTTVAAIETVLQNGRTYDVYNVTLNGTVVTAGTVTVSGVQVPFNVSTGFVDGYTWVDRGDGSLVRNNETVYGEGYIDLGFPFGERFLQIDAALTTTHDPPQEQFDFPILLGDRWSISTSLRTMGYQHIFADIPPLLGGPIDIANPVDELSASEAVSWANTTANVSVPAGDFTTFAIRSVTTDNDPNPGLVTDLWYSPLVRNLVRSEVRQVIGTQTVVVFTNLTAFSLNPQTFDVQVSLEPNPVNPGGSFYVSGTTEPNAQVTVSVPFTLDAYSGTSDPGGAYSFFITAPMTDDNTPSNADQGSHGVVVDVQSGPVSAWNASTEILLVPDLWILDGEVAFSPSPVYDGVATTIQATIHTAPQMAVYSTVEVEFSVDGVPLATQALPGVPADASLMVAAVWTTPTAGLHLVEVTVDPSDSVPETDESNNSAVIWVSVEGPDLTLVNITAMGGQHQYPDAASAGFLSEPINVTVGQAVDLGVQVLNAGSATPAGAYDIAMYNTTGPGGPPARPAFYTTTLSSEPDPGASSSSQEAVWIVPPLPGAYHVSVTVDFGDAVRETDEGNNTFTFLFVADAPDYVPTAVTASPVIVTAGGAVDLSAQVLNQGPFPAQRDSVLAFYNESSPGSPFFQATVTPLGVGETSEVFTGTWQAPALAGDRNITVAVDYLDDLGEIDEGNNTASILVQVMAPPVTTLTLNGAQHPGDPATVTEETQVELEARDRSGLGIAGTFYRVDGGQWTDYGTTGPFTLTGDGLHAIEFYSTDNLGGTEPTNSFTVALDSSPPETALFIGEPKRRESPSDPWLITVDTPLTLEASDPGEGGVGVQRTEYRVDGGAWKPYASSFTLDGLVLGSHTVEYRSVDLLGNVEETKGVVLILEGEVEGPAGAGEGAANLKPVLALALAVALIIAAKWRAAARDGRGRRRALLVGGIFAVAEMGTGVLSLAVPMLAVPPAIGLGMAVDLALLLIGLGGIIWVSGAARDVYGEEE